MPRITLTQAINTGFVNSLVGSSTSKSNPLTAALSATSSTTTSMSGALRVGARVYGQAVQGINSVISALGVSRETLGDLSKITDKMIGLAKRAEQSSIGSESRAGFDRQFQELAKDFLDTLDNAKVGDRNILSRSDLSELFRVIGLDETSADSIASVFEKFQTFDDDGDKFLASEYAQGRRPTPIPIDAYSAQGNVGTGAFTAGQSHVFPTNNPSGVAIGDVDEDGNADLLSSVYISTGGGAFAVGLGNGDGTFDTPTYIADTGLADLSWDIRAIDVNGDLHLDAVVHERWGQGISVALGNGNGTFALPSFYGAGTGSDTYGIDNADFDGDGDQDIVIGNDALAQVGVMYNQGDGSFTAATLFDTLAGTTAIRPTAADVDADGKADIIVSNYGSNSMSVLLGNGDGTFSYRQTFQTGLNAFDNVVGDINGDGSLDVVTANDTSADFTVMLGNGDGTFDSPITTAIGDFTEGLGIGDFNSDGYDDIVIGRVTSGNVTIHLSNGDGLFSLGATHATDVSPQGEIPVGDINNDNVDDIVVSHFGGTTDVPLIGTASTGSRSVAVRSTTDYATLFESGRNLRSRPDAYALLHDLKALKNQIDDNIQGIENALDVVGQNLDLVRATGLAMLDLSEQLNGSEKAEEVARALRQRIRNDASGSLAQAENLQPIAVAALAFSSA